jgi:hypothetical protein
MSKSKAFGEEHPFWEYYHACGDHQTGAALYFADTFFYYVEKHLELVQKQNELMALGLASKKGAVKEVVDKTK